MKVYYKKSDDIHVICPADGKLPIGFVEADVVLGEGVTDIRQVSDPDVAFSYDGDSILYFKRIDKERDNFWDEFCGIEVLEGRVPVGFNTVQYFESYKALLIHFKSELEEVIKEIDKMILEC
jgi:hypothetical protein